MAVVILKLGAVSHLFGNLHLWYLLLVCTDFFRCTGNVFIQTSLSFHLCLFVCFVFLAFCIGTKIYSILAVVWHVVGSSLMVLICTLGWRKFTHWSSLWVSSCGFSFLKSLKFAVIFSLGMISLTFLLLLNATIQIVLKFYLNMCESSIKYILFHWVYLSSLYSVCYECCCCYAFHKTFYSDWK